MSIRRQSEHGRLAIFGAVLIALVAGAFYLGSQAFYDSTEAASDGAAMELEINNLGGPVTIVQVAEVDVKVIAVDDQGRIKLTRKAAMDEEAEATASV